MVKKKETKIAKETLTPSLSSVTLPEVREQVLTAINNKELEQALDQWSKKNEGRQHVGVRDLELLSSIATEYLDTFILFGYNLEGERIIIQHYDKAKDRDAMMEFLKIIFYKYQSDIDDD